MAGIRGLRDIQDERGDRLIQDHYAILGYGFALGTPEESRRETFWHMLKNIFCPFFSLRSFIFIITILDIVIYFITVFYDYDTNKFLEPTVNSLIEFGAASTSRIREGEYYRLILPVFLHANLTHIAFNMILQLILGFRLEPTVGVGRVVIVYFVTAVGGVLLSAVIKVDGISVGASTALFGMIGSMLAWLIMNWKALEGDPYRIIMLIWLIILVLVNFLFGASIPDVDNWGHLGGLITGFPISFAIFKRIGVGANEKAYKFAGFVFLIVYFVLLLCMLFTVIKY